MTNNLKMTMLQTDVNIHASKLEIPYFTQVLNSPTLQLCINPKGLPIAISQYEFLAFNKESARSTEPPVYKFYKNEDESKTYYCSDHLEKFCTLTFCGTLSPLSQTSHQKWQGQEWGHACSQEASQLVSS